MNWEQYNEKLKELHIEFNLKTRKLRFKYAKANDPYKIGDKFTDHMGTIIIESKTLGLSGLDKPCMIYYGTELKKDGTPKKSGNKRQAWQCNELR
jgi:hypothetical protein